MDISNMDDIIDSRSVIERITVLDDGAPGLTEEEHNELNVLKALADESKYVDDWEYGVTLVRSSYFEDYAMEFAEDIGAIPSDASWPCTCIDWEQAARELRMDYTPVDFDGVTYWVR